MNIIIFIRSAGLSGAFTCVDRAYCYNKIGKFEHIDAVSLIFEYNPRLIILAIGNEQENSMIIKPKVRGFICTNAHPQGCAANVQEQIDYIKSQSFGDKGPKNVLVIGAEELATNPNLERYLAAV